MKTSRENATHVKVTRVEFVDGEKRVSNPCINIENWELIKKRVPSNTQYLLDTVEYIDATKAAKEANVARLKKEIEELEERKDYEKLLVRLYDLKGAPGTPWVTQKINRIEKILSKQAAALELQEKVESIIEDAQALENNEEYKKALAKYNKVLDLDSKNKYATTHKKMLEKILKE